MSLEVVVPLRRDVDSQVRQPLVPSPVAPHRRPVLRADLGADLGRMALVALLLGGWQLAAGTVADPRVVSRPSRVLAELLAWSTGETPRGALWSSIAATLEQAVPVFVVGTLGGVVLGVLVGRSGYLADVLAPFVTKATTGPRVVAPALFVIWLLTGVGSAVATVVVLVLTVSCEAFRGVRGVDKALVDNARVLGAGRRHLVTTVVLPAALSRIVASTHIAVGLALVGTVVGEYTAFHPGVGLLIRAAKERHDAAGVYAGLLVVAVLGLVATRLVSLLEGAPAARQLR